MNSSDYSPTQLSALGDLIGLMVPKGYGSSWQVKTKRKQNMAGGRKLVDHIASTFKKMKGSGWGNSK